MGINLNTYSEGRMINGSSAVVHERAELTIQTVKEHTFQQSGDTKIVLEFLEIPQELTLNKTRLTTLVEMFGDDTDKWKNQAIKLYPTRVNFGGKQVDSVAIAPASNRNKPSDPDVVFEGN